MTITNRLGRPLLGAMFISGGIDQLRDPEGKAAAARKVTDVIEEGMPDAPLPKNAVDAVRINGAVQVVGGSLLVLNRFPRLASLTLAGSLVPTTYAGHRFWEEKDPQRRSQQRVHFLKNTAMLGGLLIAAGDTGGRPSVTWRARRALKRSSTSTPSAADMASVAHDVASTAGDVAHVAGEKASSAASSATDAARHAAAVMVPAMVAASRSASRSARSTAGTVADEAMPVLRSAADRARHLADAA